MVILLGALTAAKSFASALQQAGIPYTIVDGKGFYERREIIDLINLLVFLEDSSRSLELAGVLSRRILLLMMKLDSTFSGAEQAGGADSYLMAAAAAGCMAVD